MCTRTVFTADNGRVVTGRNMDWAEDMGTDLWAFTAGIDRVGENGADAFSWTSTHSTVIATGYGCSTTDGINDSGLVGNLLYLAESDFGEPGGRRLLSVYAWTQYLLDTCATVADAVATMRCARFAITAPALPNGHPSHLHLAMSDATGDSAIFEYVEGALTVHHGREHRVMTNSPVYDQQLAINSYWRGIGGETMLPGTNRAADRYVRADHYLSRLPTDVDARAAVAGVLSVQRNVAQPIGTAEAGTPHRAETRWTSVADSTALRYHFQATQSPGVCWVELDRLGFAGSSRSQGSRSQGSRSQGSRSRRLSLRDRPIVHGEGSAHFEAAAPFSFLGTGDTPIGAAPS